MKRLYPILACAVSGLLLAVPASAQNQPETATEETTTVIETTEVVTTDGTNLATDYWDIFGPIRLRAADTETPGQIELRHVFLYGTSSDGSDDDVRVLGEIEWGIAPDHEISFLAPLVLGDGEVDGNGDLNLSWQWRLWREKDWVPAFALRNSLRVPAGYHSDGVDWTFMGLFTKTIVPCVMRFHFNPFLKVAGGNDIVEAREYVRRREFRPGWFGGDPNTDQRHFQWGFFTGFDYLICPNLDLIVDYVHQTSELRGFRNQHMMEVGLDWKLAPQHQIGLATSWTLDGDSFAENWGMGISYSYIFCNAPCIGG
jgi:hypothetical protein